MFGIEQITPASKVRICLFMPGDTPYTRTFRRAIETLGGAEELAQALGASVTEIEAWAAGFAHPPPSAFLKAIDVVAQVRWPSSPPTKF